MIRVGNFDKEIMDLDGRSFVVVEYWNARVVMLTAVTKATNTTIINDETAV
jgi:hypothetical protein